MRGAIVWLGLLAAGLNAQSTESALQAYIDASLTARAGNAPSKGSLYTANSYLAEIARDPRASRVGDLITIVVSETASALTSGATSQSRSSDNNGSITKLLGGLNPARALPNLLTQSNDSTLEGSGSTSRRTNVTATITAHITHVTPNGNLVIEGAKEVAVNSERQVVWIRGAVRQADIRQDNSVTSDRIGLLDLRVNGKGVVNSAIKRPNVIYRIFRGLLPF